jgi:hypothetical protein
MLPVIPKPPITRGQKRVAMAVAGTVDLLQIGLLPLLGLGYMLDDALDVLAVFVLMGVCGFKWQFVVAFMLELVPVVDIFPTWTALALTLPSGDRVAASAGGGPQRVEVSSVRVSRAEADGEVSSDAEGDVEGVVVPPVQPPPLRAG